MLFNGIRENYDQLIADKRDLLTLVLLKQRIDNQEIGKKFLRKDFEKALKETSALLHETTEPQTETALQRLEGYFINTLRQDNYKLELTHYAEKFIQTVESKLLNKYTNFSLRQTFENVFVLRKEKMHDIQALQQWEAEQFERTRDTVFQHINGFKAEVQDSIHKISQLVKQLQQLDNEDFVNHLKAYEQHFNDLGNKAEQLREVLSFKNLTIDELEKITEFFQQKVNELPHNAQNSLEVEAAKNHSFIASQIEKKVKDFFRQIDTEVNDIIARLKYAFDRQRELMQNFKKESLLRNNLKSFLHFLMEHTEIDKQEIWHIPDSIPQKELPQEAFRLVFSPKYDFNLPSNNLIISVEIDKQFEEQERRKSEQQNYINRQISIWLKYLKDELERQGYLAIDDRFYEIWAGTDAEEPFWEIPIKVVAELVRFANERNYTIEVERTFSQKFENQPVILWKTTINTTKRT
jgi:hypothetical protein